ncbi:unnamed protein product [Blepharisma stoltei]|uniref:Amidase domain-containing protein n=1 Tax=Blepharisma stoltei TaxID=1481888 RepID=A0AAU9KBK2_9CILI|nr:unnamed protein product [Blepharisma stoltei]
MKIGYRELIPASAAVVIAYFALKYAARKIRARKARQRGAAKLKERNSKWLELNVDPELKEKILSMKAYQIVEAINSGSLTVQQVLNTYIMRAQELGRKYSITAEEMFTDAINRLEDLPGGILYGLPISIKDSFSQKGCVTSAGLVRRLGKVDTSDHPLVSQIRESGGLPFVRGNPLQIMMWFETENNIYGVAKNPWDPSRTVGGSSGGDAGIVAARCAALAIGSDIGGSIRIPSAFCGVYGIRTTSRRTNGKEGAQTHPNKIDHFKLLIKSTRGPMGRCVEDLTLVLKAWWNEQLWKKDCYLFPMKFDQELYENTQKKKLRIGYFDYNGVFECAEVIKDIIRETKQKLEAEGHELVEFDAGNLFSEGTDIYARIAYAGDPKYLSEELEGEEPAWVYKVLDLQARFPFMKTLVPLYLRLLGHKQLARLVGLPRDISLDEFCKLFNDSAVFKNKFHDYWNSLQIDALICPIWPLVAPQHTKTKTLAAAFSYSFVWNLLDYPCGVVPVRTVRAGEDKYESTSRDKAVKSCKEIMEGSVGLPVCLQVVGYPSRDEEVLGVMKVIEGFYKFDEHPI